MSLLTLQTALITCTDKIRETAFVQPYIFVTFTFINILLPKDIKILLLRMNASCGMCSYNSTYNLIHKQFHMYSVRQRMFFKQPIAYATTRRVAKFLINRKRRWCNFNSSYRNRGLMSIKCLLMKWIQMWWILNCCLAPPRCSILAVQKTCFFCRTLYMWKCSYIKEQLRKNMHFLNLSTSFSLHFS